MSMELLKSISTQKAHKTCYKQGSILHYLGTNQLPLPPCLLLLHPIPQVLLPLSQGDTIPGLAPFLPLRLTLGYPGGPRHPRGAGPLTQESPPILGPQSPSHHLFKALLEISLRICPLLPSSGGPTSTAALFQGMLIAVGGICMTRFIMISWPLPKT